METILIYLAKSSALIAAFYLAYTFLVQKETFFTSNRYFLLSGLFTSVLLPLLFIKKIVFIEKPSYFPTQILSTTTNQIQTNVEQPFDFINLLYIVYGIIVIILFLKIFFELLSFFKLIKNKEASIVKSFVMVDVDENINPFSFFKYIVFNSKMYSNNELQNILSHEKVHSRQKHAIDVLIAKLFCTVFWFNPFVWLYKKAIIQNLEYIADQKAIQNIENKKAYQMTLLKVVSDQNCLSITNSFYQSLIKKRIVMLNKNQSNRRNVWKYALIIPTLVAFIIFFQVQVVAQEKLIKLEDGTLVSSDTKRVTEIGITKNSSDSEIKSDFNIVKKDFNVDLKVKSIKRNSKAEIIQITISADDNNGSKSTHNVASSEAITPFKFVVKRDFKGKNEIGFYGENATYSEEISNNEVNEIANFLSPPSPPTPPNVPDMGEIPTPPTPPDFPSPPNVKAPTNPDDKEGWKKFEEAMEQFDKKMKNGPDMKKFKADMKVFEAKMKKWQPDMTKFEKEMEIFEAKMKVFEENMKTYEKNKSIKKQSSN